MPNLIPIPKYDPNAPPVWTESPNPDPTSFPVWKDYAQPEVHASSLATCKNRLVSVWFGGTKEGTSDNKIWKSSRVINAQGTSTHWENPVVIAAGEGLAHWNPQILVRPGTDTLLLFYKTGTHISLWKTLVKESHDAGETWGEPRQLVDGDKGGRASQKNKPIVLSNGTIIAPGSREPDWRCFSDSTKDFITWDQSWVPLDTSDWSGEGAIQPTVVELEPGKLSMLARSSTGFVARTDSEDWGKTWSTMYKSPLYNNNSGIDSVLLEDKTWIVIHNPVNQSWGPRTPLVLSASKDQGQTWKQILVLEDKPPPADFAGVIALDTGIVNNGKSEFSYPAIISDGKGGVFFCYTYERYAIKHTYLSKEKLVELYS